MDVLLVSAEDERSSFVRAALEAGGHRVARTATSAEGVTQAGRSSPDAVLFATDELTTGLADFRSALESRAPRQSIPVLPTRPDDTPEALLGALARLEPEVPAPVRDDGVRTILLVDDRETHRRRLMSQFLGHGWKVIEAINDRGAALELIDHSIDCVLLNAMLGGRTSDGVLRAAAEIRKVHPSPYALVVMVDAEDSDTAPRMLEAGADDVVGRTIGASLLRRRLDVALHLRDLLRENRRLKERLASLGAADA